MRIGATHRDVAIILLGAFSRYINHLEDEDMIKPLTKSILKALSELFRFINLHLSHIKTKERILNWPSIMVSRSRKAI